MDTENQPGESSLFGLNIDIDTSGILKTSAQWSKVLAILGFIFGSFLIVFGFVLQSRVTGYSYSGGSYIATLYLVVFFIYGAIFIISSIFLLNFSNRVAQAIEANDQQSLNSGLSAIKNAIIFWTIIFVMLLLLMFFAFLGSL